MATDESKSIARDSGSAGNEPEIGSQTSEDGLESQTLEDVAREAAARIERSRAVAEILDQARRGTRIRLG